MDSCAMLNSSFNELDAEYALHDAMDSICKYLNMKDLGHVAQVCRSWRIATMRAISKRHHIQRMLIPHTFDDFLNESDTFDLASSLKVKPYVGLLFFKSSLRNEKASHPDSMNSLEDEVMSVYKRQLPHKMIGLEICEFLTDESVKFDCPDLQNQQALETTGSNGILGLFLPSQRQCRVNVAWCKGRNGGIAEVADRMVEKLAYDEPQRQRSTLLVFAHSLKGYFIADQVIRVVRRRFASEQDSIWGGVFNKELVGANCQKEQSRSGQKIFVALRLSGPSHESWSMIIDCGLKKQEVDQKLHELKDRLRLKRCSLGLAYGPRRTRSYAQQKNVYRDSHELMRAIKRIFTSVPFVGLFNRDCRILIGDDSLDEECYQKMDHHNYMTMMILTYD